MSSEQFNPKCGEIVMVSNDLDHEGRPIHVQKFVIFHNGLYFCERDDGRKDRLIGWKSCIPNQGHEYCETQANDSGAKNACIRD